MKLILFIFSIALISFLPKKETCKHFYALSDKWTIYKCDTIAVSDGSMYEIFNVTYLKPFECFYCLKDTIINNPKPTVLVIKESDAVQYSYRQL